MEHTNIPSTLRQTDTGGLINTKHSSTLSEYEQWQQGRVKAYAQEIGRGKMHMSDLSPELQEQVREYMKGNGQSVFLKHDRERKDMARKQAKEWAEAGIQTYRPGQETYTTAIRKHLDNCEAGEYPSAKSTAEAVAGEHAKKFLGKQSGKRLRQALQENRDHPGMQLVNSIADRSSITAMVSGTVSACLGTLAHSHKLARRLAAIEREQQQARIEREQDHDEIQRLRERVQALETRHELEDEGKDWREEARRIREAEPGISNRKLAALLGRSEGAVRKYVPALSK